MMTFSRAVIDSNVIISAAMNLNGTPYKALNYVTENMTLLLCPECLAEMKDVAKRPKLEKYIDYQEMENIFDKMGRKAEKIIITGDLKIIKDDPDDDKFLETAIIGKADCIISGDKHLLNLRPAGRKKFVENWQQAMWEYEGFAIPIVKPSEFLELVKL